MSFGTPHIENRQTIRCDADSGKVFGDEAAVKKGSASGNRIVHLVDCTDPGGCGITPCKRRAEALNPPALLIDKDGSIVPAHGQAEFGAKRCNLPSVGAIPGKEDKTPGPVFGKECPLNRV